MKHHTQKATTNVTTNWLTIPKQLPWSAVSPTVLKLAGAVHEIMTGDDQLLRPTMEGLHKCKDGLNRPSLHYIGHDIQLDQSVLQCSTGQRDVLQSMVT
jgi:hypothetical protein